MEHKLGSIRLSELRKVGTYVALNISKVVNHRFLAAWET